MPITLLEKNVIYTLLRFAGHDKERNHLESMGLVPGVQLSLIGSLGNNYIVKVGDTSLGLTKDIAKKLIVE